MARVLLLVAVIVACVPPANAQVAAQAPAIQAGPSDYLLFRFFFAHVLSVVSFADDLKAAGKDDAAARARFKDAARLADTEAKLLKSAAARCSADLDAHARTEVATAVQNVRAQHPGVSRASDLPPAAAAQLNAVQALKAALGPDRFQKRARLELEL